VLRGSGLTQRLPLVPVMESPRARMMSTTYSGSLATFRVLILTAIPPFRPEFLTIIPPLG